MTWARTIEFPVVGQPAEAVRAEIRELCRDHHSFADGSIFNSICSRPLALAEEIFCQHTHANFGDNRLFPGLHRAQRHATAMLVDLLGCGAMSGCATSGGTESNLLAMSVAVERFRQRSSQPVQPEIVVPDTAHFSFEKIARLLGARLVRTALDTRLRADVAALEQRLGPRVAAIVVSAGASETGAVDPIGPVARLAQERGIYLHVDAATGGFLLPFLNAWRSSWQEVASPAVSSITVDPHKYGYTPIPAGYLLVREAADFDHLRSASHYRGTHDHATLLGTRPGAAVLALFAALRHLGRAGYQRLVDELVAKREALLERLVEQDFAIVTPPDLMIVAVRVDDPAAMERRLEQQGLMASVSKRFGFLRLVVQRHQTVADLDRLVLAMVAARSRRQEVSV